MATQIEKRSRRTPHLVRWSLLFLAVALVHSSCAPGHDPAQAPGESGFWLGLWHGIIFPITFFISLFTEKVGVYEVANNGNWYDFGFFVGIVVIGGGGGVGARRAKRHR